MIKILFPMLESKTDIQNTSKQPTADSEAAAVRSRILVHRKGAKSIQSIDTRGSSGTGRPRFNKKKNTKNKKIQVTQRWDRGKPDYYHFTVIKRGYTNAEMIERVAKRMHLLPGRVEVCGSKDRQGITWQRVSVWRADREAVEQVNAVTVAQESRRHQRSSSTGSSITSDSSNNSGDSSSSDSSNSGDSSSDSCRNDSSSGGSVPTQQQNEASERESDDNDDGVGGGTGSGVISTNLTTKSSLKPQQQQQQQRQHRERQRQSGDVPWIVARDVAPARDSMHLGSLAGNHFAITLRHRQQQHRSLHHRPGQNDCVDAASTTTTTAAATAATANDGGIGDSGEPALPLPLDAEQLTAEVLGAARRVAVYAYMTSSDPMGSGVTGNSSARSTRSSSSGSNGKDMMAEGGGVGGYFPNYFGQQRFGSPVPVNPLVGRLLLSQQIPQSSSLSSSSSFEASKALLDGFETSTGSNASKEKAFPIAHERVAYRNAIFALLLAPSSKLELDIGGMNLNALTALIDTCQSQSNTIAVNTKKRADEDNDDDDDDDDNIHSDATGTRRGQKKENDYAFLEALLQQWRLYKQRVITAILGTTTAQSECSSTANISSYDNQMQQNEQEEEEADSTEFHKLELEQDLVITGGSTSSRDSSSTASSANSIPRRYQSIVRKLDGVERLLFDLLAVSNTSSSSALTSNSTPSSNASGIKDVNIMSNIKSVNSIVSAHLQRHLLKQLISALSGDDGGSSRKNKRKGAVKKTSKRKSTTQVRSTEGEGEAGKGTWSSFIDSLSTPFVDGEDLLLRPSSTSTSTSMSTSMSTTWTPHHATVASSWSRSF
mmetsp:Transcript_31814/g.53170  ORF Transcript_31814/g.53170 Transcript_31814/m.53170 type:complete len:829 (+) Transcript_31814:2-2488(+)